MSRAANSNAAGGTGAGQAPTSQQSDRRATLRAADDEQVALTRARLFAAFRRAASERVPRLSVVWVCAHSGVARSTFYTHFATVDELASEVITEPFAAVAAEDVAMRVAAPAAGERVARSRIARAGLDRVLTVLESSRELIDYAIDTGSRPRVIERIVDRFVVHTRETIVAEYTELSGDALTLITEFVSAGTAHAMMSWLLEPGTVSRDELLDQIVALLPQRLAGAAGVGA